MDINALATMDFSQVSLVSVIRSSREHSRVICQSCLLCLLFNSLVYTGGKLTSLGTGTDRRHRHQPSKLYGLTVGSAQRQFTARKRDTVRAFSTRTYFFRYT